MKKSRMKLIAGVVSAAALFTMVSIGQTNSKNNVTANATQQLAGVNTGLSDQQLRAKATSIIPGTIIKTKYSSDRGRRTFEADIVDVNGIKREISLYTSDGSVEEIDYDYDAQGNRFIRQDLFVVNKTFEQAQQIALARIPGTVIATKQESEHGLFIHKFLIKTHNGTLYTVKVETKNGTVLEVDHEDKFDRSEYFLPPVAIPNQQVQQPVAPAPVPTPAPAPAPAPVPQAPQQSRFINEARARQLALAAVPGTVLTVKYDYDDGVPEFEYKIKKANGTVYDVTVSGLGWVEDIDYEGRYVNGIFYED